jgi:uncharacterized protein (TIGR02588 family)
MSEAQAGRRAEAQEERTPALEWIAGGVGAVLTLAMIGFLGWEAYQSPADAPPAVEVSLRDIVPAGEGFVAEIAAVNHSPETAAAVDVEGVLRRDGREVERSQVTLDYVPGDSERRGGLFFSQDPRDYDLELRALGYAEP